MRLDKLLSSNLAVASAAFAHQSLQIRQQNWTIGQTVPTSSGSVIGHAAPNATEVSEYLGIRYAKPPLGSLRFAAPLPYTSAAAINASAFGPSCLIVPETGSSNAASNPANLTAAGTQIVIDGAERGARMSEDCLTLNLWTKPQTGESAKAVMVWVYGGAFQNGWTRDPQYNGQYLADLEDVVVVSLNYRVNIFGFPSAASGFSNVGLLDQRLAVEWVRDNIAAFGGDPHRITLFGQSAGAASIDFYSYAWPSDPIVNGMILESGTTQVIPPLNETTSVAMWYNITTQVGCSTTASNVSSTLACMQAANSSLILSALALAPSFVPTIDNIIVFNNSEYNSRSLSGNFIQAPLLIGTNDNEEAIFRINDVLHGAAQSDSFYAETNLNKFFCPCAARANASVYNHVPTWRYRWFGVYNNTNLTSSPDSGAYHGSEIPIIFNTPPAAGKGIANDTAEELEVMAYMRGAWATFAKDPANGLKSYQGGWPLYYPTNATLIRLAFDPTNASSTNLALPKMYDAGCGTVFAVTGNASSTSGTPTIPSPTGKASSGTILSSPRNWIILTCAALALARTL